LGATGAQATTQQEAWQLEAQGAGSQQLPHFFRPPNAWLSVGNMPMQAAAAKKRIGTIRFMTSPGVTLGN